MPGEDDPTSNPLKTVVFLWLSAVSWYNCYGRSRQVFQHIYTSQDDRSSNDFETARKYGNRRGRQTQTLRLLTTECLWSHRQYK